MTDQTSPPSPDPDPTCPPMEERIVDWSTGCTQPPTGQPWTARHETEFHLAAAAGHLQVAGGLASDVAEPCAPVVRAAVGDALALALTAQARLREQHHLSGALRPEIAPGPLCDADTSGDVLAAAAAYYAERTGPPVLEKGYAPGGVGARPPWTGAKTITDLPTGDRRGEQPPPDLSQGILRPPLGESSSVAHGAEVSARESGTPAPVAADDPVTVGARPLTDRPVHGGYPGTPVGHGAEQARRMIEETTADHAEAWQGECGGGFLGGDR